MGSVPLVVACACAAGLSACIAAPAPAPAPAGEGADPVAVAPGVPDASSCRTGPEATQRHGTACLCCHADEFGVAGSVDPAGPPVARVVVTGTDGDVADMAVNGFSNFFRHFPLATPVRAVVVAPDGRSLAMRELAPSADCNACHFEGGPMAPIVGP
jgi:cytochrome c5